MKISLLILSGGAGFLFLGLFSPADAMAQSSDHRHRPAAAAHRAEKKAKADRHTFAAAAAMEQTVNAVNPAHATVEDYHRAAQELQGQLSNLISGCRMTGEDHEKLHEWLNSFTPAVGALAACKTGDEGREAHKKLRLALNEFHLNFEPDAQ